MPRTLLTDKITLTRNDGSSVIFSITEHIGSGASCVVYHAVCDDKTEHLLKEYYPVHLDIERSSNGALIVPAHQKEDFEAGLTAFKNGSERQKDVRLSEKLKNFTSNVQGYYCGNGTAYIDMTCFNGRTYNNVGNESLYTLMVRMRTLTQVIGYYHNAGLLHLDIKPENIYVRPEEETAEDVMLFDFDSVVEIEKIKESATLSFTKTWAAPEQLLPYKRDSICKATDLFPIGEMIFTKIYGRHSTQSERRSFAKYPLDHEWEIFKNVNPRVFPLIQELFSHTICATPARRYQTAAELMEQLDKIIRLADPKEPYLISTLPVPKSFFIGRDAEIEDIHARLQQSPVLFLHGIGGIGKSELAKQYAVKYRDEYDTVIWAPYVSDIISMIADDSYVKINHFERVPDEKIEEYYERKKNKLQSLIDGNGDRTLMIVDNFDTAEDNNIKDLLNLSCRILVTTRVDFSDEYAQKELSNISNPIEIFNEYYKKSLSDAEQELVSEIIGIIGGHTMTVELLAKQMMAGRVTPEQMLTKLKFGGISDSGKEKVRSSKDGNLSMQSTYDHIQSLFDLSGLDESEKYVLANLSLIPHTGISAELFCEWCEIENFDTINRLAIEGWIQWDKVKDYISLHPVIHDIAIVIVVRYHELIEILVNHLNGCIEPIAFRSLSTATKSQYLSYGLAVANNLIRIGTKSEIFSIFLSNEIWCNVPMSIPDGFEQVEKIYRHSIQMSVNLLTGDVFRIITTHYYLACLYGLWDKNELCKKYLHEGITQLNNIKAKNTQYYLCEALLYHGIGLLYSRSGTKVLAKQAFLKSLKAFKKTAKNNNAYARSISSYIPLIQIYRTSGDYFTAAYFAKKALKILYQYENLKTEESAHLYYNLANIYVAYGKLNMAEHYYLEALKIFDSHYDEHNGYTGSICLEIGSMYLNLGNLDASEQYLLKASFIHEAIYGSAHCLTASSYALLSIVYDEQNIPEKSEEYLEKSMAANLLIIDKNDISESTMALSLFQIGQSLVYRERYDEALCYLENSYSLFKKIFGERYLMTKSSKKLIKLCTELSSLYNQIHSQVND